MIDVPGGSTGLLVCQYQGKSENAVYRVDPGLIGLLAELRAHEKQAAEELGQWSEKHAVTVKDGLAERLIAARARVAAREKASA